MPEPVAPMSPLAALERIVYLLDRSLAPAPKIRAFHRAAAVVRETDDDELRALDAAGRLQDLPGIGASTSAVIHEALAGQVPARVAALEETTVVPTTDAATPYVEALRGDAHLHSDWSDGGAPIEAMARAAMALGHEWIVLTDHSPRLTVAHGLSRERLGEQLVEVRRLNETLAPFRILTGMEVDILEDGALDMDDETLAQLDVVVASVHSKLRMDATAMTRRMVMAVTSPHVDILGHCTGRKLSSSGEMPASDTAPTRPPSTFDADIVFTACAQHGTAVEINCRPERQDPPEELLALALARGCTVAVNTDAHAPGQLEWQPYGCDKAARTGVPIDGLLNAWDVERLVTWTADG